MSKWFYTHAGGLIVIIGILVFLVFSLTVLPGQSAQAYSAGTGSPDTSLFYTPEDLNHMAQAYGSEGRQTYIHARFTFDLVFPLVYTFFLTTSISWLLARLLASNSPWRALNLVPFTAMILDFFENICTALVMAAYPVEKPVTALLASVFTPLKWLFVGASFALLLTGGLIILGKTIFSQK